MQEKFKLKRSNSFLSQSIKGYRDHTIKKASKSTTALQTSENVQAAVAKTVGESQKTKMSGSKIDSETAEKLRLSEVNIKELDQRMQLIKSAKISKQELNTMSKLVEESRKKLASAVQSISKLNECLLGHISMEQPHRQNDDSVKESKGKENEEFGSLIETFPIILVLTDKLEQLLGNVFPPRFFENQIQSAMEREELLVRSTNSLKATNQCYLQRVKSVCKKSKKSETHLEENRRFVEEARNALEMEFQNCNKFISGVYESHHTLWHSKLYETRQGLKSALQTAINSMNIPQLSKNENSTSSAQQIAAPSQEMIGNIYKCSSNSKIESSKENEDLDNKHLDIQSMKISSAPNKDVEDSPYGSNLELGIEYDKSQNKGDYIVLPTQERFPSESVDQEKLLQKSTNDTEQVQIEDKETLKSKNNSQIDGTKAEQHQRWQEDGKDGLQKQNCEQEDKKTSHEEQSPPETFHSPTSKANIEVEKPNQHEMQAHRLQKIFSTMSTQNERSGVALCEFNEKDTSNSKDSTNFLYFKKGDRLNVNLESAVNGWVHGQIIHGHYIKDGWFPESFVEMED